MARSHGKHKRLKSRLRVIQVVANVRQNINLPFARPIVFFQLTNTPIVGVIYPRYWVFCAIRCELD